MRVLGFICRTLSMSPCTHMHTSICIIYFTDIHIKSLVCIHVISSSYVVGLRKQSPLGVSNLAKGLYVMYKFIITRNEQSTINLFLNMAPGLPTWIYISCL